MNAGPAVYISAAGPSPMMVQVIRNDHRLLFFPGPPCFTSV